MLIWGSRLHAYLVRRKSHDRYVTFEGRYRLRRDDPDFRASFYRAVLMELAQPGASLVRVHGRLCRRLRLGYLPGREKLSTEVCFAVLCAST